MAGCQLRLAHQAVQLAPVCCRICLNGAPYDVIVTCRMLFAGACWKPHSVTNTGTLAAACVICVRSALLAQCCGYMCATYTMLLPSIGLAAAVPTSWDQLGVPTSTRLSGADCRTALYQVCMSAFTVAQDPALIGSLYSSNSTFESFAKRGAMSIQNAVVVSWCFVVSSM